MSLGRQKITLFWYNFGNMDGMFPEFSSFIKKTM